MNVTAVVVTYNRKSLLEQCLLGIGRQTRPVDTVLVIDNASTDGTSRWLHEWLPATLPQGTVNQLTTNRGGAGGFAEGLRQAVDRGADWIWMMDDDAVPHPDALEQLMQIACDNANVYGSLATSGDETSWIMTLLGTSRTITTRVHDIPTQAEVQMLPFLGFFIHRSLVERIGVPDAGFFIAADDVEYCLRARKAGSKILVAGQSRIEHPKSRPYKVRLPGYTLTCLALPPWKRYYDTRNRLLIARRYYGLRFLTQTIPGSFVRLFAALIREPHKFQQLYAWQKGMIDGCLGRTGKTYDGHINRGGTL